MTTVFDTLKKEKVEIAVKAVMIAVLVTANIMFYFYVFKYINNPQKILIFDKGHNIHQGVSTDVDKAQEIFKELAVKATKAYYTRTPDGLLYEAALEKLFHRKGESIAKDIIQVEKRDFKQKKIYQYPVIKKVLCKIKTNGSVQVLVSGKLYRKYTFEGTTYFRCFRMQTFYLFRRNDKFRQNKEYPYRVVNMKQKPLEETNVQYK